MAEDTKKHKKTERVVVHCRVRPLNDEDLRNYGKETIIDTVDSTRGTITFKREFDRKCFTFDSVYDGNSNQRDIYSKVGDPVVNSVLQGYNGTIFAYGQTGTGKTFTMIGGPGESKGVIPRSMAQIFSHIQQTPTHSFSVKIGFLQLYMEMLQDLLTPDENKTIKIRENTDDGVYLTGVSWKNVNNVKQCMDWLNVGDRNRSTAFTSMNAHSSRSHAVYMVKIEKRVKYTLEQLEDMEKKGDMADQSMTKSTLYLVDLAGSERVSKSRATGSRLDEAKNINLALLALGNCIQALSDKKAKYVPFRDSKLTRLLEDSLGGNSKTSLVVTIGPSSAHVQESLSALQFGQRAMKIENRPEKNIKVDYRAMCSQLQTELDKFNDGNNMVSIEKSQFIEEINNLKAQVEKLTTEKEQMEIELEEFRKGHNDLSKFEEVKKAEIQKLQFNFKMKLEKKEAEHKKFLDQVDEVMVKNEEELKREKNNGVELRNKVTYLTNELKGVKEELEQEKNDRQIRAAQLVTEIDELKQKLQLEKGKNAEMQEEVKKFTLWKQEKEALIVDLTEKNKLKVSQQSQELESLTRELQKHQSLAEKYKTQLQQKMTEFKEAKEKAEKSWEDSWKIKEKQWRDKNKDLEDKVNSLVLQVTQLERENASVKEDLKGEKENKSLITANFEKQKDTYEEHMNQVVKELQGYQRNLAEMKEFSEKLQKELESEKEQRKVESLNAAQELKASKHKNSKLLKVYKELESTLQSSSAELQQSQKEKNEYFQSVQKISIEKEEALKELEQATKEISSLNKDRSKLILKNETLSKKTSNYAKVKEKLSTDAEVKQQELKMLMERRENLEEEVETLKVEITQKIKEIKVKDSIIEENKVSNSNLSQECSKKDAIIETQTKKMTESESKLLRKTENYSHLKEKYKESQNDFEKQKVSYSLLGERLKEQEQKYSGLLSELRTNKESLDKTIRELTRVKEELVKSTMDYETQLASIDQQKDQLSNKYSKLLEEHKVMEVSSAGMKSSLKQRNTELMHIKDKLGEFENFFRSRIKICQESASMLESKSNLLSTSQDTIKYYIIKLKETIKAKEFQLEKTQNLAKKEALLQAESHLKEINSLKQAHKEQTESAEEKFSQEVQELQSYYEDIIKKTNLKSEKSQEELKNFYFAQISQINSTHSQHLEDLKSTQARVALEIQSSYESQLQHQKEDLEYQLESVQAKLKKANEKYTEDIQKLKSEWENKLEQAKLTHEETLNAMLKLKQKEVDHVVHENRSLKMEFESSLDRQKTQSSTLKNHQLGLFEEIQKSHEQELEALNMENQNRIKRKDAEVSEVNKKLKMVSENYDECSKEIDELKANVDKLKADNKKLESEARKVETSRRALEENLKLTNKKFGFEKERINELEQQNSELSEKLGNEVEEKNKALNEVKKLNLMAKKSEEESNLNYKSTVSVLENRVSELKQSLLRLENEKEVNLVLQGLLIQVEKQESSRLKEKSKQIEWDNTQKLQTALKSSEKVLISYKSDYSSYISHLILEKLKLTLELTEQKALHEKQSNQLENIKKELEGDFSLTNYIRTSIKDTKRGVTFFEFLTSFTTCYQRLQEKLTPQNSSMQIYVLSKVVHEKFLQSCRSMAFKSIGSKKLYEKPITDIEKELGVTGQAKAMSQQEVLAKKVRDSEKNIQISVSAVIDHIITVIELQQLSVQEIKSQLESRKRKIEPLMQIEDLKKLEISVFPPVVPKSSAEITQIISLKHLAGHLTANLSMISALYSSIFSRCIYLEYLLEDKTNLVTLLLSNMQLRKTFVTHSFSRPFKFSKDQVERASEFLIKGKDVDTKVNDEDEQLKATNTMHSRAGLQLMKRHFQEINTSFTSICKRFMKP